MESKTVKVIDEHSIDRVANVICSIDVDGSDYVVYWIERDSDNDNIFVSKLLKNNDQTSNMVNIEDSMEKSKISDIVKGLIKYSIDNESDTLTGNSVNLPSGKTVKISAVLFNKDQNINVQKTYITTVKKSVTKVTSDYYVSKEVKKEEAEIFPVQPSVDANEVKDEPIINPFDVKEEVVPLAVDSVVNAEVVMPEPEVVSPVIPSIPEVAPTVSIPPVMDLPKEQPIPTPLDAIPSEPKLDTVQSAEPIESVKPIEPVAPVSPIPSEPKQVVPEEKEPVAVATSVPTVETKVDNGLVFDASKETNLKEALGEVSDDANIAVSNIETIREFGQDEPVVASATPVVANENVTPTSNGGFANNKFFMVIAIAFFVASCVFLGYEVFNYFQMTK